MTLWETNTVRGDHGQDRRRQGDREGDREGERWRAHLGGAALLSSSSSDTSSTTGMRGSASTKQKRLKQNCLCKTIMSCQGNLIHTINYTNALTRDIFHFMHLRGEQDSVEISNINWTKLNFILHTIMSIYMSLSCNICVKYADVFFSCIFGEEKSCVKTLTSDWEVLFLLSAYITIHENHFIWFVNEWDCRSSWVKP